MTTLTDTAARISLPRVLPAGYEALSALDAPVHATGLEPTLLALVQLRVSQLNGCAYCLDMHATEAREAGESQQRLDVLAGWREAGSLYSARERAALALAEHITAIGEQGVPD